MDPQVTATLILIGGLFLLILLRFPIAYAIGIASVLSLIYQGANLMVVGQRIIMGVWSFSLMAVPFFITMGVIMGKGGIAAKLIDLANACVGWMRGGMAMVNIVSSIFFGAISGSAAADVASVGSIMIPVMEEQGYDRDFSTAVSITSSIEGFLIPPSHNMVIYATAAGGVSIGSLFLAGYLPGFLLAFCLMICAYIISVKRNYPKGDKFSIRVLFRNILKSAWALAAVLIVVVGVVGGFFTATESAAIAVIYSLFISVYIYKGLNWRGVWRALDDCIATISIVMIIIAISGLFAFCLTVLNVPTIFVNFIIGLTDNPIIIKLMINVILLLLGTVMDMAPLLLIATPILLPVATSVGIDPVHFGIIMMLNCGIGLITPPVGTVLFVGSAVGKVPVEKVVWASLPFYFTMLIALMLLTFFPSISMFLPNLIMR